MTVFTRIMAFAMLAIWVSAFAACIRDCASVEKNHFCCPSETDGETPATPVGDCVLGSALTKLQDERRSGLDIAFVPVVFTAVVALPERPVAINPLPAPPIPSLSRKWQFLTRSALPVRAPSFVS